MEHLQTFDEMIEMYERVDTTTGTNGYPQKLRVAYTADTMGELRTLHDRAKDGGYNVQVVRLHRRDGWALWGRLVPWNGLEDDNWTQAGPSDHPIVIDPDTDPQELAFDAVGSTDIRSASDLHETSRRVRQLAHELPDPGDLCEGEKWYVFLGDDGCIDYTVKTGQNGYSFDTHHYKTGLIITAKDEE